ncbi:MAG: 3-deoxy-manno-octulosonate cytidylyltransferase [Cyclobacteriaceae bacterium]|nr:MAG: 3-deoxy-manno-octulosonate cytidylyltransferase [Cyclobacteriaceae bacterium]
MNVIGIIPVRFKSTRFPGKPMVDINGKSMVQRVYEQASKASGLDKVLIATDEDLIYRHIQEFGGNVCMTRTDHPSGTDRCKEALEQEAQEYNFVVNIQGDEPFIDPRQIDELINGLDSDVQIATQAKVIEQSNQIFDPNCVKVIIDPSGNAIYFSRTAVPHLRNHPQHLWTRHFKYHQHIGIYAYRSDILQQITHLPVSPLEQAEGLEQLRWIENSYNIRVMITTYQAHGIDTPEDLEKVLATNRF